MIFWKSSKGGRAGHSQSRNFADFGTLNRAIKANIPSFPHHRGFAVSATVGPNDKKEKVVVKINFRPGAKISGH